MKIKVVSVRCALMLMMLCVSVINVAAQNRKSALPIEISVAPNGRLNIACGAIKLNNAAPVVDGKSFANVTGRVVERNANRLIVNYDLGAETGTFVLTVEQSRANEPSLSYKITNVPANKNFYNFGLKFENVTGMTRYYRSGYHSWDGSLYVQPENLQVMRDDEKRYDKGFAVSQIVPANNAAALTFGFERHDKFQQTFTYNTRQLPPSLEILTHWDLKTVDAKRECGSEVLRFFVDENYENGLKRWARIVAARATLKPRLDKTPLNGWNSWYDQYAYITDASVIEYLNGTKQVTTREKLPMKFFQIDDGFTPEMGDWLLTDYDFPRGVKPLLDDVRKGGFQPGLWIAPFMVGNRSQLFRDHPDWVLYDLKTKEPKPMWRLFGEYRWHKRSEEYYVLDASNPQAFEYLQKVFRTWRKDWGSEFFKTDFMHYGSEWGPDEVRYHTPGMTRIEVWHKVAKMIRDEIGEQATYLGCGAPLWAGVGLFDATRIGGDIGVSWTGGVSAQSLLQDLPARNFTNHILYQIDPDSILLRDKFHQLSNNEVRLLALFGAMSGGVMTTSDNLAAISPERVALWKMMLSDKKQTARYPFLGRDELRYLPVPGDTIEKPNHAATGSPLVVQVRDSSDGKSHIVHVLNISTQKSSRTLTLDELGIDGTRYVYEWTAKQMMNQPTNELVFTVDSHDSKLFFLSPRAFKSEPQTLTLD